MRHVHVPSPAVPLSSALINEVRLSARIGIPARLSEPALDNRVAVANRLIGLITDRVNAAGGTPVPLTPESWAARPAIDGLLLPGGGDLDSRCYGQEPDPRVYDSQSVAGRSISLLPSMLSRPDYPSSAAAVACR